MNDGILADAADKMANAMLSLRDHLVAHKNGAHGGRLKAVLAEEVDIGLGTAANILGVLDKRDFLQLSGHDCVV